MSADHPEFRAEDIEWFDGGEEKAVLMTRRNFGRISTGLLAIGFGGVWASTFGSQPALAASGFEDWIARGAEVASDDGNVGEITFGDPDDGGGSSGLGISWEGFNDDSNTAEFDVEIRGSEDDADSDGWTAAQEEYDSIIPDGLSPGSVTLIGTSGDESFDWDDIFGEHRPGDVLEHAGFDDLSAFEQEDDGGTRTRVLDVRVSVEVPSQGVSTEAEDTATLEVSNVEAGITIGGEGGFVINAD